jgi:hypothetical protein
MIELLERVRVEAKARLAENNGQSNPLQKTGVSPRGSAPEKSGSFPDARPSLSSLHAVGTDENARNFIPPTVHGEMGANGRENNNKQTQQLKKLESSQ